MADLGVAGISKAFRGPSPVKALDDVSFEVPEGEILVLVGPSGCGKTTTLRCVAGLEDPDTGTIRFGGRAIFDSSRGIRVKTHRRDIGLVFQSFALWPHMSAFRNIEFPLRAAGVGGVTRRDVVLRTAKLVDLDETLLQKRPGQLSGGQQQRVALARALAAEPGVILFDEPLSNLDARLREDLRSELQALHARLSFTGVYVTHDLTEALALGDRVAVMAQGRISQIGSPHAVFERPENVAVARLLGLRKFVTLRPTVDGWDAAEGPVHVDVPLRGSGQLTVFAWPNRMRIVNDAECAAGEIRLRGLQIVTVAYLGSQVEVTLRSQAGDLRLLSERTERSKKWQSGDIVTVACHRDQLRLYDDAGAAAEIGGARA